MTAFTLEGVMLSGEFDREANPLGLESVVLRARLGSSFLHELTLSPNLEELHRMINRPLLSELPVRITIEVLE